MKKIELTFKKDLTKLAGNKFGKQTYESQVCEIVDNSPDDNYTIVIPERIDRIASSFIQGFFEIYIEKFGLSSLEEHIFVESTIENINEMIIKNLE